ncbi:hypothetical protein ACTFIR_007777 [Dictyostelium discoideum]
MEQLNSNFNQMNEVKLKMDLSFICNKSKQPPAKLQGIFSTFGVDQNKEFYYNYLDYKKNENHKNNNKLISKKPQQCNLFHPYSSNSKKIKNHFQNHQNLSTIQSLSNFITDNIIIIDNSLSKSQHYIKNHDIINKNNSNNNNNNCVSV